jgi:hypothetical protein
MDRLQSLTQLSRLTLQPNQSNPVLSESELDVLGGHHHSILYSQK